MNERWIEIKAHFRERQLVETSVRFESIAPFCDWVDAALRSHVVSGSKAGMYFELRNWAGGEASVGINGELWSVQLGVPEYPKLLFPLCDPSRSSEDVLNIQYIGEMPLSHFLAKAVAVDSVEQWMMKGFVWLCPWKLFSQNDPD